MRPEIQGRCIFRQLSSELTGKNINRTPHQASSSGGGADPKGTLRFAYVIAREDCSALVQMRFH
jgi:hypothetical protein